jgi:hypothetical protein
MAYVVFEKVIRRVTTPMLTISPLGRLNFNTAASDTLHKNAVEDVLLMWDKEARKMAIRSITKKDSRSYRMRYSKRSKAAGFAAKPFLEFVGYDYSKTRSFPCAWNDEQGMFEITFPTDPSKSETPSAKPQPQRFPRLSHGQKAHAEEEKERTSSAS